ncbi:MAG: hypothetical protein KJO75_14640, partial [Dactylosporangium sp.]|nr:hypothetical protein [Dactylosporangium sp.]
LQTCDEASRQVLHYLRPLLARAPLLVLATARPDPAGAVPDWIDRKLGTDVNGHIRLGPLAPPAVAALVAAHLGGSQLPERLVSLLTRRSAGNPLAVREYLRAMLAAGLVRPNWGRWTVEDAKLRDLDLADDVATLLVRRVETLDGTTRLVLTTAAAVGPRFDPALVDAVCDLPPGTVSAALFTAATDHIIEATGDDQYGFLHDRMRAALLDAVNARTRRRMHHRIAQRLEHADADDPDSVYARAHHYLLGETSRQPQPVYRAVLAAGFRALAEHAAADASGYFREAERLAPEAGVVPDSEFHLGAGTAALRIGQFVDGCHHFEQALAVERDPLRRARIFICLADAHQQRWQGDDAIDMVRRGLAALGHPLPAGALRFAVTTLASWLGGVALGRLPRRFREIAPERRPAGELRAELLNAGVQAAAAANRIPLMAALNLRGLPVANRLESGWPYLRSKANLAIFARVAGARSLSTRLLAAAQRATDPADPYSTAFVAWSRSLVADLVVSTDAGTGIATRGCLAQHGQWLEAGSLLTSAGVLGVLQVARGHPREAMDLCRFALEHTDDANQILGTAFGIVGPMAEATLGQLASAAAGLDEVRTFLSTIPASLSQRINVALAGTVLAVEQGETGAVLDEAIAAFTALGVRPREVWPFQRVFWVYQAFGRLAQVHTAAADDRTRALARATHAVKLLRRSANGPVLRA